MRKSALLRPEWATQQHNYTAFTIAAQMRNTSTPPDSQELHKLCANHLYLGRQAAQSIDCQDNIGNNHPNCQCIDHTHSAQFRCKCLEMDSVLVVAWELDLDLDLVQVSGLDLGKEMGLVFCLGSVSPHSYICSTRFPGSNQNSWAHGLHRQTNQPIVNHHLECTAHHHCENAPHKPC